MESAPENTVSGTQARVPEAYMEPSPVTVTPEGSVGPVADTDAAPSTPTATVTPAFPTPPAETPLQTQEYRVCSKKCSGGPRPVAEFTRSTKPYGPLDEYKHCNECNRKYGRRGAPRLDVAEFRRLYVNADEGLHLQWLEEEAQRRRESQA